MNFLPNFPRRKWNVSHTNTVLHFDVERYVPVFLKDLDGPVKRAKSLRKVLKEVYSNYIFFWTRVLHHTILLWSLFPYSPIWISRKVQIFLRRVNPLFLLWHLLWYVFRLSGVWNLFLFRLSRDRCLQQPPSANHGWSWIRKGIRSGASVQEHCWWTAKVHWVTWEAWEHWSFYHYIHSLAKIFLWTVYLGTVPNFVTVLTK